MQQLLIKTERYGWYRDKQVEKLRKPGELAPRHDEDTKSSWEFVSESTLGLHALHLFLSNPKSSTTKPLRMITLPKKDVGDKFLAESIQDHCIERLGRLHRDLDTKAPDRLESVAGAICDSEGLAPVKRSVHQLYLDYLQYEATVGPDYRTTASKHFARLSPPA